MRLFHGMRLKAAELRQFEEQLFEIVALEVKNDDVRPGLWAKAFADADGDAARARAGYLKLRVQSLKDELLQLDDALQAAADMLKKYGDGASSGDASNAGGASPNPRANPYAQNCEEKAWFEEQERLAKATRS